MAKTTLAVFMCWIACALAADCPFTDIRNVTCPSGFGKPPNYCSEASLAGPMIIRCANGCPTPGNCADILLTTPPEGTKTGAVCWDEPEGGNAQCTYDCVQVTALNGTVFYPVGCKSSNDGGSGKSGASTGTSSVLRSESSGVSSSSKIITLAPGPVVVSTSLTADATTTTASTTGTGTAGSATATTSGNAAECIRLGMAAMPGSIVGLVLTCMGMNFMWW